MISRLISEPLAKTNKSVLLYFQKVFPEHNGLFVFHLGANERKLGPVLALPWQKGLQEIGL